MISRMAVQCPAHHSFLVRYAPEGVALETGDQVFEGGDDLVLVSKAAGEFMIGRAVGDEPERFVHTDRGIPNPWAASQSIDNILSNLMEGLFDP
jgi:hypothetical protein